MLSVLSLHFRIEELSRGEATAERLRQRFPSA